MQPIRQTHAVDKRQAIFNLFVTQSGCEAGENYGTSDEPYFHELEDITLEEATRDEVIFYMDGEDSRTRVVFIA